MIINCPDCETRFKVTIEPVDHAGQKYTNDSPITPGAMRAVLDFMRFMGPGRCTNAALFDTYDRRRDYHGWPALTHQAITLALKRNGAKRWRTSTERGWVLPEVASDQRAAPAAPSVRKEIDSKDFQNTIRANRTGDEEVGVDPLFGTVPVVGQDRHGNRTREDYPQRAPSSPFIDDVDDLPFK
jgi:hypothetical protein